MTIKTSVFQEHPVSVTLLLLSKTLICYNLFYSMKLSFLLWRLSAFFYPWKVAHPAEGGCYQSCLLPVGEPGRQSKY